MNGMNAQSGPLHSACGSNEYLLEDYLAGTLPSGESEKLARHLTACDDCRLALADAESGSRVFRLAGSLAGSPPDPHPAFARVVMARIREHREAGSVWNPFVALAWKFAATATLALLIMVTYAVSRADEAQPESTTVTQSAVRDIFSPVPARPPDTRDEAILMVVEPNYANR